MRLEAVKRVGRKEQQAVMMGLQAKAIESQIDVNKATARKINAEATSTSADLPKKAVETESQWQGIELLKKQTIGEEAYRDWEIEQYHRVIKQVCHIEKFPVRRSKLILCHF